MDLYPLRPSFTDNDMKEMKELIRTCLQIERRRRLLNQQVNDMRTLEKPIRAEKSALNKEVQTMRADKRMVEEMVIQFMLERGIPQWILHNPTRNPYGNLCIRVRRSGRKLVYDVTDDHLEYFLAIPPCRAFHRPIKFQN